MGDGVFFFGKSEGPRLMFATNLKVTNSLF